MNTNLEVNVRTGNASLLFRKHFGMIPFKVDALVGFLPSNGKWFSALDFLIQQSIAGYQESDALPYGKTVDGGFISYFHKEASNMAGPALNNLIGDALYIRTLEEELDALDMAFFDVVWGIVEEPSDMSLAMLSAILLAAKQKAKKENVTTLVLPWYGTKETILPDTELTEHEKLIVAQVWTLAQINGLRAAAVQLESMDEFRALASVTRLGEVAKVTYSAS